MAAIVSSRHHIPHQNPIDLPFKTDLWDSNSKTQESHSNKTETTNTGGGWSFLQALSNVSHVSKESKEKESVYVHPQVKRSSIKMSQKSLELCTEKLGNETGSDIVDENNCYNMDLLCSSSPTREKKGRRKTRTPNFPPPWTSMRGSESLRVRSHREDGRLLVHAMRVPQSASCFHAERSHGRLRLCFLGNHDNYFDSEETQASNENEEGVEEEAKEEKKWKKQKKRTKRKEEEEKQR